LSSSDRLFFDGSLIQSAVAVAASLFCSAGRGRTIAVVVRSNVDGHWAIDGSINGKHPSPPIGDESGGWGGDVVSCWPSQVAERTDDEWKADVKERRGQTSHQPIQKDGWMATKRRLMRQQAVM